MRTLSKSLLGVAGAAVAATSLAAPAEAQRYRRYHDRDRGVDAGDVIAGVAIVGGVAALISALDGGSRYGRYDDRYSRGRSRGGTARQAVDACARAARREARYDGDRARVGQIEDVERAGNGYYRVYGTLNVQDRDFGYRRGYDTQRARFTCTAGYGRVADLNIGQSGYGGDRYDRYDRYNQRYDYRYPRY